MRKQLTSIFLGAVLIFAGLILFLEKLDLLFFTWFEIYPVILLLLATFSYLSVSQQNKNAVFWGTCFAVIGLFFLLRNYGFVEFMWTVPLYTVFAVAPGLGLVALFLVKPDDWGVLIPGGFLLLIGGVGIAQAIGMDPNDILAYWPVLLILLGLGMILRSIGSPGGESSE